jgi:hypothetical protein
LAEIRLPEVEADENAGVIALFLVEDGVEARAEAEQGLLGLAGSAAEVVALVPSVGERAEWCSGWH